MKKLLYFVSLLIAIFSITSCGKATAPKEEVILLEFSFTGNADWTSAVYHSYSLGYSPADVTEAMLWAKKQKDSPERIYVLRPKNGYATFIDKKGIKIEDINETNEWLINKKKIYFLAKKYPGLKESLEEKPQAQ